MALSLIDQAKKLLMRKRYNEVISLLEPHVFEYSDSFPFHFYIGLSFLNLDEIAKALDYFSAARKIKPQDPDLTAAYAAIFLRRGDTGRAVEYYLRIQSSFPKSKIAKKGLVSIRKNNNAEAMGNFIQSEKFKKLYPSPFESEIRGKRITVFLIVCILTVLCGVIIPFTVKNVSFSSPQRANLSEFTLDKYEKKNLIDMEGSYTYVLTEKEILSAYSKAQAHFQNFKDNEAQIEVNRILNSNASFSIKQKAMELTKLFKEQGFDTINEVYTFDEIRKEPMLYQDCWVIWKGMPSNVKTGTYSTVFNLLVGYDTKHTLEGVVPVFCEFIGKIDIERPIRVLGQIQIREGGIICIKGKGLNQTGTPEIKN